MIRMHRGTARGIGIASILALASLSTPAFGGNVNSGAAKSGKAAAPQKSAKPTPVKSAAPAKPPTRAAASPPKSPARLQKVPDHLRQVTREQVMQSRATREAVAKPQNAVKQVSPLARDANQRFNNMWTSEPAQAQARANLGLPKGNLSPTQMTQLRDAMRADALASARTTAARMAPKPPPRTGQSAGGGPGPGGIQYGKAPPSSNALLVKGLGPGGGAPRFNDLARQSPVGGGQAPTLPPTMRPPAVPPPPGSGR